MTISDSIRQNKDDKFITISRFLMLFNFLISKELIKNKLTVIHPIVDYIYSPLRKKNLYSHSLSQENIFFFSDKPGLGFLHSLKY